MARGGWGSSVAMGGSVVAESVDIVSYVERHPGIAPDALADHFQVKDRTLRLYVQRANASLDGAARIERRRGGYELVVSDEEALAAWRSSHGTTPDAVPSTPRERVRYLLNDLLSRADWITLDELSSALYVSRASISSDLKRVEEILADYDLSLEKRPHHGIRVSGTEMDRRLCLASLVVNDEMLRGEELAPLASSLPEDASGAHGRGGSASLIPLMRVAARCVDDALEGQDFEINPVVRQNLLVHISIAVLRMREGNYIPMEQGHLDRVRQAREYGIAELIARRLDEELGIELPREEIAYMAIHLAGKRIVAAGSSADEGLVITDEVWNVATRMIEVVYEAFRYDFRGDLELRMNLARHIAPLSVRLRYHMAVDNPLLTDIKTRFSLAYAMAQDASSVLVESYGARPSEDETGYIALAFALALERQKTELPKKRVLVVCASGRGTAKLLEYRYLREFGAYLGGVETCDVSHLDEVDFTDIDYIFTTVPLRRRLPVPVCEVGLFLDESDISQVREVLDGSADGDGLGAYLVPELFFPHLSFGTKEEVVDFLCARARDAQELPDDFEELVWERERLARTSFGNLAALPHPMRAVGERTLVTVGLLDQPVEWGTGPVRAVFLIVISREGHDGLERFYEGMAEFLMDAAAIGDLLKDQTYDNMMALIGHPAKKGA